MKLLFVALLSLLYASPVASQMGMPGMSLMATSCITHGFTIKHLDACDYETLLRRFEIFFEDPFEKGAACANTAEQELFALLGVSDAAAAQAAVDSVCARGYATSTAEYPFSQIAEYGREFDRTYYQGGTFWNEQYATKYGDPEAENGDGLSQVLREDAEHIKQFYNGPGQYGLVEFPNYREFRNCEAQSVYCCWPQDRQANDNNGNCDDPYDVDCIDADPADNTDLCYANYGNKNRLFFPDDDNNNRPFRAEGPIHCHGFAWSDQLGHFSAGYRGNNLFYVSMYDHFHQRGYVSNIPGKPMCGCTEDMPVASRADCTEMDVDETLFFHYDASTPSPDAWSMTVEKVEIDFNSCQGTNRQGNTQNNDLWSYANRLYMEERLSADVLNKISKSLVGDNPNVCDHAEQAMMAGNRYSVGYAPPTGWFQLEGRDAMSMESNYGPLAMHKSFEASTEHVIKRVCATCEPTHRHIYIKMLNGFPAGGGSLIGDIAHKRSQTEGFVWKTDFEMYSSLQDALDGKDPWKCPNDAYNYGAGFPGECSPLGNRVRNQHSRFDRTDTRRNVGFYLRTPTAFNSLNSVNIGGYNGDIAGSAYTEAGGTFSVLMTGATHLTSTAGDIGGTSDQLQMIRERFVGKTDMAMSVQVIDSYSPNGKAKAGIMLRESMDPGAPNVAILMEGKGRVVVQARTKQDGGTKSYTFIGQQQPLFLRLGMQGGSGFTFYTSENGAEWTALPVSIVIDGFKSRRTHGGMVLGSTSTSGGMAEAVFDSFSFEDTTFPAITPAPTPTPAPDAYTDIGVLNRGVAMTDYMDGGHTWYIMYSATLLPERFPDAGLPETNSEQLVAVRYDEDNSQWLFDKVLGVRKEGSFLPFTPQPGDRLLASLSFATSSITPLQGENGMLHGVATGYAYGDLNFRINMYGGRNDYGEVWVQGTFFSTRDPIPPPPLPPGTTMVDVGKLNKGVARTDYIEVSATWYMMYSETKLSERFSSAGLPTDNADHIVGVRYDEDLGQWVFDKVLGVRQEGSEVPFTPQPGDRLLAEVVWGRDYISALEGESGEVHGIAKGYDVGDLVFHLNHYGGRYDYGEVWIEGSYFMIGLGGRLNVPFEGVGDLGKGAVGTDSLHGEAPVWYVMYTEETITGRFPSAVFHQDAASNLLLVRPNGGSWIFDRGGPIGSTDAEIPFTPEPTDLLLATITFGNGANARSLKGVNGNLNGIQMGYWLGDLQYHPNKFGGRNDGGEVWVTGTSFVRYP